MIVEFYVSYMESLEITTKKTTKNLNLVSVNFQYLLNLASGKNSEIQFLLTWFQLFVAQLQSVIVFRTNADFIDVTMVPIMIEKTSKQKKKKTTISYSNS